MYCWLITGMRHLACALLSIHLVVAPAVGASRLDRVLVIETQNRGVPWADDMARGLATGLGERGKTTEIYNEYLDAVRFGPAAATPLAALLRQKYADMPPDVIVALGPNALEFALAQRPTLAPGKPILFSSIQIPQDMRHRLTDAAGFVEQPAVNETLTMAHRMFPHKSRILLVGRMIKPEVRAEIERVAHATPSLFPSVEVMADDNTEKVVSRIKALGDDTVVLIAGWTRDSNGAVLPPAEAGRLISEASNVPAFSLWDATFGSGSVGGKLLIAEQLGLALGAYVKRVLDGEPVQNLPLESASPTRVSADYHSLKRFDVDPAQLPPDSWIINKPIPIYESYPTATIGALAVILILSLIAVALIAILRLNRRATARIMESEERYRVLFEENPNPMFVYDEKSSTFLGLNSAFTREFGYTAKEIVGQAVTVIVAQQQRELAEIGMALLSSGNNAEAVPSQWCLQRRDGKYLEAELSSRAIEYEGRSARLVLSSDVSARVAAERALQLLNQDLEQRVLARTTELERAMEHLLETKKLASLGSLVAGIAHELNTPLGNATTVVSTLYDHAQAVREAIERQALKRSALLEYLSSTSDGCKLLECNVRRASDLVTSFKQVAADQGQMLRRTFDLAGLLEDIATAAKPVICRGPITLHQVLPDNLLLDSYPGAVEQVLMNLLTNAVTHGLIPGKQLDIRVSASLNELDIVRLRIVDNGAGMSSAVLQRACDPFFTTRLGQGGSGLGLYLVHNLIYGPLGGAFQIHSREGLGTLIEVHIPLTAPTLPAAVGS